MGHDIQIQQVYYAICYDKYGNIKWEDGFKNLVVTVGRNQYLDATLKTGVTSPLWYLGLKGTGTVVAADTMASHAGWAEIIAYSQATRPQWVPGTITNGSLSNSGSVGVFSINGTTTIAGAFLANNNTKNGTTGILLGAGDFTTARAMESGDTLNLTVTCSITAT